MWKDYRPGVPAGSTIRKQGVNFFLRDEREGSDCKKTVQSGLVIAPRAASLPSVHNAPSRSKS